MPRATGAKTESRLTEETLHGLLGKLSADAQASGIRYEKLRQRLILFFVRRLLSDPEDLADEVIDRLAHRLQEGVEVTSVEAYALGIARHVAQEQAAVMARERTSFGTFLENISAPFRTTSEQTLEQDSELDAMERSLAELPEADVQLLTGYYLADQGTKIQERKRLAQAAGLTQAALRKRIFALCRRLRDSIRAQTGPT